MLPPLHLMLLTYLTPPTSARYWLRRPSQRRSPRLAIGCLSHVWRLNARRGSSRARVEHSRLGAEWWWELDSFCLSMWSYVLFFVFVFLETNKQQQTLTHYSNGKPAAEGVEKGREMLRIWGGQKPTEMRAARESGRCWDVALLLLLCAECACGRGKRNTRGK